MHLVQEMEDADDRDSEGYVEKLEQILNLKLDSISSLRDELRTFQSFRQQQLKEEQASQLSDELNSLAQISSKVKSLRRQSTNSNLANNAVGTKMKR